MELFENLNLKKICWKSVSKCSNWFISELCVSQIIWFRLWLWSAYCESFDSDQKFYYIVFCCKIAKAFLQHWPEKNIITHFWMHALRVTNRANQFFETQRNLQFIQEHKELQKRLPDISSDVQAWVFHFQQVWGNALFQSWGHKSPPSELVLLCEFYNKTSEPHTDKYDTDKVSHLTESSRAKNNSHSSRNCNTSWSRVVQMGGAWRRGGA